jgi:DNA-binding transcriptional LysR family regulator
MSAKAATRSTDRDPVLSCASGVACGNRAPSRRLFIAAEPLRQGTLIRALRDAPPIPDTIYAVYPAMRHIPRKVRALIDHLVEAFSDSPRWERDIERAVVGTAGA